VTNGKHLKAVSGDIPTVFTPFNEKQNGFTDGMTIAFFNWSHDLDRFFEIFHNLSKKGQHYAITKSHPRVNNASTNRFASKE
jgi:hypothetical protein